MRISCLKRCLLGDVEIQSSSLYFLFLDAFRSWKERAGTPNAKRVLLFLCRSFEHFSSRGTGLDLFTFYLKLALSKSTHLYATRSQESIDMFKEKTLGFFTCKCLSAEEKLPGYAMWFSFNSSFFEAVSQVWAESVPSSSGNHAQSSAAPLLALPCSLLSDRCNMFLLHLQR